MGIIEKIGLRKIEKYKYPYSPVLMYSDFDVEELEIQRNEMLEVLIKTVADWDRARSERVRLNMPTDLFDGIKGMITAYRDIIEKATEKTWTEIKVLLYGSPKGGGDENNITSLRRHRLRLLPVSMRSEL